MNREIEKRLKRLPLLILSGGFLVSCWSCKREVSSGKESSSKPLTEESVGKLIVKGMPEERIVREFGRPAVESILPDGRTMGVYNLLENEIGEKPWRNRFSGFEIFYRNGIVDSWLPVFSSQSISRDSNSLQLSRHFTGEITRLSFYLVSRQEMPGSVFIDTPALPKLGYVKDKPDLSVSRLASLDLTHNATTANEKKETDYAMAIKLEEQDRPSLERFTREHVGEEILIEVKGRPIAAPIIMAPIKRGDVMVNGLSELEALKLQAALEPLMPRQSK